VVVVAGAALLAWAETGSIDAADWLLYAVLAGLLLAVVAFAGLPPKPPAAALAGLSLLVVYAGWQAVSIAWSPLPSLANCNMPASSPSSCASPNAWTGRERRCVRAP